MLGSLRSLITLAILANPAAASADRLTVTSQDGPSLSAGATSRSTAAKHACLLTSREAEEGHRRMLAGRFAEARGKLQSALKAVEASGRPEPDIRACLMNMIGVAEVQQRNADLAVQWFERALELKPRSEALVALLTSNLANAYSELNRLERAEELARQAIYLSGRAFGSDDPDILFPQTTLAFIHVARGEYATAEPVLRRVLYQAERSVNLTSYEVSSAAGNLAFTYLFQGKYALARELFQKALSGLESSPMRKKDEIPLTQAALAVSCAAGGRGKEANMWLERALGYARQELTPEDPALPVVLERAAMTRFFLKDYGSGMQLFDGAITLLEARYGPGSQEIQGALERYAGLLRQAKTRSGQIKAQRKGLDARLKAFALKR